MNKERKPWIKIICWGGWLNCKYGSIWIRRPYKWVDHEGTLWEPEYKELIGW